MPDEKAALRRTVVAVLRATPAETRARLTEQVLSRARSEPVWTTAREILAYHPMTEEVDIRPLLDEAIKSRGRVWLPCVHGSDLSFRAVRSLDKDTTPGPFGILEPHAGLPELDPTAVPGHLLVLTPGVAFDGHGRRLGRGRGYYDRFLAGLRTGAPGRVTTLALAFSLQLRPRVPTDEHDQVVDLVVTERDRIVGDPARGTGA